MEANMMGKIVWWTNAGRGWRRATRAEVEALRDPQDECFAMLLGCDGAEILRSSAIYVACDAPVRLYPAGPWRAPIYTVKATEYAAILREVETRMTEIVTRPDPRVLREALLAG